ncbi:MAG TPA: methyl-accepting chemotaxis protein [Limnochordia bacterium]|nr:methyl-accepting chemotaxis protein [Limnochordia bacterium]
MSSRSRKKANKEKSRARLNLRLKARLILAFALIALVPLTLLTLVVISQTQQSITSMVEATLTDQAKRIADSIASSLQQLTYDLQNLTVNPSIEQMAVIRPTSALRELGLEGKSPEEMEIAMAETRNLEANTRTQAFLENTVAEYKRFSQLIVVNTDGMVLGATERPDRFIHANEHWFREALNSQLYISDIQRLPDKEEAGLVLAAVIYRSSSLASGSARPAGAVRGLVPLTFFTAPMLPIVAEIPGGELQLLSSGQVILEVKNEAAGPQVTIFLENTPPAPIAVAEGESQRLGQTSSGEEALTAGAQVALAELAAFGHNWEIRMAQPTRYALTLVHRLSLLGYVGIAVTGLVVVVIAIVLTRRIAQPLIELTAHARDVARGRLRQYKPKHSRRDEAGELTAAFNEMTAQLARLLHRVRSASEALSTSSQEISAGMEEMAAGAQTQSEDVHRGTRQIEEMDEAMAAMEKRAQEAVMLSQNATSAAAKGEAQALEAVEGMDTIKQSVDSLTQQTQEIAKILALIREIAEQTNLLSLNAAIEAARAGEQGRSFAVVAQEVGELAIRSQKATEEIEQALKRIQSETLRSLDSVAKGQKEVHDVRAALQEITKATKETEALVQEIADEASAQTSRTREAVALFQSIGDITEQTAAGTEETAAAAQNLAELAQQLQEIISSFQDQAES